MTLHYISLKAFPDNKDITGNDKQDKNKEKPEDKKHTNVETAGIDRCMWIREMCKRKRDKRCFACTDITLTLDRQIKSSGGH